MVQLNIPRLLYNTVAHKLGINILKEPIYKGNSVPCSPLSVRGLEHTNFSA